MNDNLMAVLSLAVIVAFLAVLIGFVQHLTQTLTRTGKNLVTALSVTTSIRQNSESIVDGVLGLNKNLQAAAAGLTGLVGSAQQRAASLSARRPTTSGAPVVDHEPRHLAHSASGVSSATGSTTSPTRPLRDPSAKTSGQPSPAREIRREFHVRGAAGQEETATSG